MDPIYPRILPDRDKVNDFYLDEDVVVELTDGHKLEIQKGFRFDAHSVPWWARLVFPRYIPTKDNKRNDIYAAMVHDYLVATEHWHRFSRSYMDYEYSRFHNDIHYKMSDMRATWMPWAVSMYSKIKYWGKNYRGKVKPNTVVKVEVTSDTM